MSSNSEVQERHVGSLRRVADKITEFERSASLFDVSRNIARFSYALSQLEERVEENDTPVFRRTVLNMIESGEDIAKIKKFVERGVEGDKSLSMMLNIAERQATLQTKASELMLRGQQSISAKQVIILFSQFVKIIARECTSDLAKKLTSCIFKEVFSQDPKIMENDPKALISGENDDDFR